MNVIDELNAINAKIEALEAKATEYQVLAAEAMTEADELRSSVQLATNVLKQLSDEKTRLHNEMEDKLNSIYEDVASAPGGEDFRSLIEEFAASFKFCITEKIEEGEEEEITPKVATG